LEDDACRRVPERHGLRQSRPRLIERRSEAFLLDLLYHALDVIRPLAGFGQQAALRELRDVAFGAGGDERRRGGDDDAAPADSRSRQIAHRDHAVANVLCDLFQRVVPAGMTAVPAGFGGVEDCGNTLLNASRYFAATTLTSWRSRTK